MPGRLWWAWSKSKGSPSPTRSAHQTADPWGSVLTTSTLDCMERSVCFPWLAVLRALSIIADESADHLRGHEVSHSMPSHLYRGKDGWGRRTAGVRGAVERGGRGPGA